MKQEVSQVGPNNPEIKSAERGDGHSACALVVCTIFIVGEKISWGRICPLESAFKYG
jgi:hypothetical protein